MHLALVVIKITCKGQLFTPPLVLPQVCYVRDIPAPAIKPPPLGAVAALVNPKLRVFTPRKL